jgi:two-component system, cell cycle sensor histidine kinase and response regulator CckA
MSELSDAAASILVVDDDPAVRAVAGKVLRRFGYEVMEAASGPEALRAVRERPGAVDLLLTDLVMPGMGGRELSERMRAEFPSVSVLFMSAYTEDEGILSGGEGLSFLAKPFDVETLLASVRQALGE